MDKEHLKNILFHCIGLMWNETWENEIYEKNADTPVREQDLYNVSYGRKSGFLTFDYKALGLEFVKGTISGSGISIDFKLSPYEKISVTVGYSRFKGLYNYVLIRPYYKPEHWIGKKSIHQQANLVRNEKEFLQYQKRIDKRFNSAAI